MRKFVVSTAALMLCAIAGAQTIVPTTGSGADQVGRGTNTASVTQKVTLNLPVASGLHLDVTDLQFDISQIGHQDNTWYCVGGTATSDQKTVLGANFWNQTQVLPMGTSYTPQTWPNIKINGGAQVTQYPPAVLGTDNELVAGSKNHFICYRTFILQKFSNTGYFRLSVARDGAVSTSTTGTAGERQGQYQMYIQDNPCDDFGQATGLYELPLGGIRELIPRNMTAGTTGARAVASPANCGGYKSWLDDLVVIAVKVDGDLAGKNVANLTYTLESSAAAFGDGRNN